MKANASSANDWATMAQGAGIGVFPTCAGAIDGHLGHQEIERRRPLDTWLSCLANSRRIPGGMAPD
jgi:hypothetical protein